MYPSSASSARLVPDDQSDERAFFARDLDEERDLSKQTVKRGHRHDAMRRPSIGARILKSLARFFATVLIGIGLTLAWQTYGEQAKQVHDNFGSFAGLVAAHRKREDGA